MIEPTNGATIEAADAAIANLVLLADGDLVINRLVAATDTVELRAGSSLVLPQDSSLEPITTNELILISYDSIILNADLTNINTALIQSEGGVAFEGSIEALQNLEVTATGSNLTGDNTGNIVIVSDELRASNMILTAKDEVQITRTAVTDYNFSGSILSVDPTANLALVRIDTAGNFSYILGANDIIQTDALEINAGGDIGITNFTAGLSLNGGSLTAAEGGQIQISTLADLFLGTLQINAINGLVDIQSINGSVLMGSLGLITSSDLIVSAQVASN